MSEPPVEQAPRPYPPSAGLPRARALGRPAIPSWAIALALIPPGWIFIARANRWHITPSVIVMCLCWIAVVGAGYALTRAAAALLDHVGDDWFTVRGSREELEREKRSLLRAIKEIEFDRDTGKVAVPDAQALIAVYRGRAIDVIKTLELGGGLTPRERILAELKARAEIVGKAARAAQKQQKKAGKAEAKVPAAVVAIAPETDDSHEAVAVPVTETVAVTKTVPVAETVAVPVTETVAAAGSAKEEAS